MIPGAGQPGAQAPHPKLAYMPLWVLRLFGSVRFASCPGHAQGTYLLLLCREWAAAGEGLPSDDGKLARLAGLTPEEWAAVREDVLQFFEACPDGQLRNSTCEQELALALEKAAAASIQGQRGAAARQRRAPAVPGLCPGTTPALPEHNPGSARAVPRHRHESQSRDQIPPRPPADAEGGGGDSLRDELLALGFRTRDLERLRGAHPALTVGQLREWRQLPETRPDLLRNARSRPAYLRELVYRWGTVESLERAEGPSKEQQAAAAERAAAERSRRVLAELQAPREVATPDEISGLAGRYLARRERNLDDNVKGGA